MADNDNNVPGFVQAQSVFTELGESLQRQGQIWNGAWLRILNENYGFRAMLKDMASTYQNQYQTLENLMRLPFASGMGQLIPAWANVDLSELKDIELNKLHREVRTRSFRPDDNLEATELAPLGGSRARFRMQVERLSTTGIRVNITTLVKGGTEWNLLTQEGLEKLNGALQEEGRGSSHPIRGQYLGLVFRPATFSEPPLAVVTLRV